MRNDNRDNLELRPITLVSNYTRYAEGSVQCEFGHTKVICTASVEDKLPKWLMNSDSGWITAEYSMLPRSTHTRMNRDRATNSGRSREISRLIGRSLRVVADLKQLKNYSITIDCDVIQADGGTRTTSITGGFVAMVQAFKTLVKKGVLKSIPVSDYVAAVSIGISDGQFLVDLNYEEDNNVDADINVVMTGSGNIVEIQGTSEIKTFGKQDISKILDISEQKINTIVQKQREILNWDPK